MFKYLGRILAEEREIGKRIRVVGTFVHAKAESLETSFFVFLSWNWSTNFSSQ